MGRHGEEVGDGADADAPGQGDPDVGADRVPGEQVADRVDDRAAVELVGEDRLADVSFSSGSVAVASNGGVGRRCRDRAVGVGWCLSHDDAGTKDRERRERHPQRRR